MSKAVFTHKEQSRYDDLPESRYHFPRTYLRMVEQAAGDWIVYYEPRRGEGGRSTGRQAYFAVARVASIERDPNAEDHFYARITDYLPLPSPPRYVIDGRYFESALRRGDGATNKGQFGRAVRLIPDEEFDAILAAGFLSMRDELGADDWIGSEFAKSASIGGFAEEPAIFARPLVERLAARRFRDAAFARQVKSAYENRCAFTGLRILNGGGRPEVQAAHIRPVHQDGPDTVRNGLALSGTAHWMFDRGLLSVDDDYSILIADDSLPDAAKALVVPERTLILPKAGFARPHPAYLAYHRDHCFKG